jgi:hypothetical protein
MTLTVRSASVTGATTASRSLTHAEMDANWAHFVSRDSEIQASLAASTGAALVGFTQSGSGASSRTMQAKGREVFSVEDFGAVGDGSTDDTSAIQAALTAMNVAGGGIVKGVHGKTYLVSQVGTKTINSADFRYCLLIPDSVYFDLNGSTLKLAASQNAALVMNSTAGTTQNLNLGIGNGRVDGNQANQTAPAAGEMACVYFYDVDRPRVEHLRVDNPREYAGRFVNCYRGYFNDLYCDDSNGDGWSFGTTGSVELRLFESFIDNIYAKDCTGVYGSLEGNGALFTVVDCRIGKVTTKNCAGGIKIQNSSEDSSFGLLEYIGGANSTSNSGIKVQGAGGSLIPTRISIDSVHSNGAQGRGLYIDGVAHVSVGKYVGVDNGQDGSLEDVRLEAELSENGFIQVGQIYSDGCDGSPAVRISGTGLRYQVGSIMVRNPALRAVQVQTVGSFGSIGSVFAVDDRGGSATMTFALNQTDATAVGSVDHLYCNLTESANARVANVSGSFNINEVWAPRLKQPKIRLFDHFLGDVIADQWNTQVGSGAGVAAATISAATNGRVRMTTGADAAGTVATNGTQLDSALNWQANLGALVFECRVQAVSAITGMAIFIGFTDQVAALECPFTMAAGDVLTSVATDAVGVLYHVSADTDRWWAVGVANDVDATKQDLAVAPVAGTYETWRIEVTSSGVAYFFRNGTAIGSAMTGAIRATVPLTPVIHAYSPTGNNRSLDVDFVLVEQNSTFP